MSVDSSGANPFTIPLAVNTPAVRVDPVIVRDDAGVNDWTTRLDPPESVDEVMVTLAGVNIPRDELPDKADAVAVMPLLADNCMVVVLIMLPVIVSEPVVFTNILWMDPVSP